MVESGYVLGEYNAETNNILIPVKILVLVKNSGLARQSAKIPSLERVRMGFTAVTPARSRRMESTSG